MGDILPGVQESISRNHDDPLVRGAATVGRQTLQFVN